MDCIADFYPMLVTNCNSSYDCVSYDDDCDNNAYDD